VGVLKVDRADIMAVHAWFTLSETVIRGEPWKPGTVGQTYARANQAFARMLAPPFPKPLSVRRAIIDLMVDGPTTTAHIAQEMFTTSRDIARTMGELIASGWVERVDGRKGRGTVATYALTKAARDALSDHP
jgi:hypothetical protein